MAKILGHDFRTTPKSPTLSALASQWVDEEERLPQLLRFECFVTRKRYYLRIRCGLGGNVSLGVSLRFKSSSHAQWLFFLEEFSAPSLAPCHVSPTMVTDSLTLSQPQVTFRSVAVVSASSQPQNTKTRGMQAGRGLGHPYLQT